MAPSVQVRLRQSCNGIDGTHTCTISRNGSLGAVKSYCELQTKIGSGTYESTLVSSKNIAHMLAAVPHHRVLTC